jgi:hypothetical protein
MGASTAIRTSLALKSGKAVWTHVLDLVMERTERRSDVDDGRTQFFLGSLRFQCALSDFERRYDLCLFQHRQRG